jgi:SAM-dependent MidA family methyltransferase
LNVERWMLNTQNGNPALIRLIRAEIEKRGPVSFAWFMQEALYHPEHGYYSSGRCAIGRSGDYFTNVSVGPLFGQLLAAQFAEIWDRLGKPDKFVIVEQGAHHGEFARDVLESARKHSPDFFAALCYQIVEPFSILRDRQAQTLQSFTDKSEWRDSIDTLEPFIGVHFSNELIDAMPVRLIAGGTEKFVGFSGKNFLFVERSHREPGKFNQVALDWVEDIAAKLKRGYVLTIDYGHAQPESQTTVQVHTHHRHLNSPFEQIGYADITACVDWTSIVVCAETHRLRLAGFTDQHHFLAGIISEWSDLAEHSDAKTKRALQTLLHPEMLGRTFQVLALAKNIESAEPLAGFKFARAPRRMLGV